MPKDWGGLRPEQVARWINFEQDNPGWTYDPGARATMASRQAEGVAHLWNLLSSHHVALLADEVGTGKTFQALGVASLLWKMTPGAKVLVMAPNRDICRHWKLELAAFVRFHYREEDGRVKAEDEAVPPVGAHYGLRELTEAIENRSEQKQPAQFYVTTIHSLSGLLDGKENGSKLDAARIAAAGFHRRIIEALGPRGFDLVIVDEAHYFRNPHGGSQRAAAAGAFFGGPGARIGRRALLLTATPSHTQLGDVANILGFFLKTHKELREEPAEDLMRKYALRRFRIMAGTGSTKHQYRAEIATPCGFDGRPDAEMFFALYQRRLVHDLQAKDEKRRMLYGFLEGFESAGAEDLAPIAQDGDGGTPEEEVARDFHKASDTELLRELSRDFRRIFDRAPEHPKYGHLVEQCAPRTLFGASLDRALHEDKHLVFVRRIPSVRELTKRVNEQYDRLLARELCDALNGSAEDLKRWEHQRWSREDFNVIAKSTGPDLDDDDDGTGDPDLDNDTLTDTPDAYLGSRIADLFVTKQARAGKPGEPPTDASRFSLSLRRSTSLHAMFLEPASDYVSAGYTWHYAYTQGGKPRSDYTKAAHWQRLAKLQRFEAKLKEKSKNKANGTDQGQQAPPPGASPQDYEGGPIETVWSLVFPHLHEVHQNTLRRWATERPDIAENFSHYLKAGFLFASPVIVELYGWQTRFNKAQPAGESQASVQQRYRSFFRYARERIADSLLLRYFASALDTFEQLCDKIVDHKAGDWRKGWRTLTTLSSPAWYGSGESSHRQHLILGFNSPFYPNTLVATSVFQEGVNLHLNCRKVHHYGIAWTPGDNEQRVGRVDRLFGKVNGLLKEKPRGTVTLDIHYPYLQGSFDEDQVGSFIERKHAVEEKMDRCMQGSFDKEIRLTRAGWKEFLRQPVAESNLEDPYPARFGDEDVPRRGNPFDN
jgi:hypothetical protein